MEPIIRRVNRATMQVDVNGDERAHNVDLFVIGEDAGQAQISDPHGDWTLHILGTPSSWRHLAKVIEDAAMELEGQLAEQAVTA